MAAQHTTPSMMNETVTAPTFSAAESWPAPLKGWFCSLVLEKPQTPPDVPVSTWESWLVSVQEHGLSSLLFSHLRQYDSRFRPPADIFASLRTGYFAEVARIMVRRTQMNNLLKRLEAAGVASLVLKGAALGEVVYPDVFQRPSGDIDVLVPKADYQRARTVMLENGYRSKRGDRSEQMGWVKDEEFLPAEDEQDRQYVVELHWDLTSQAQLQNKIDVDGLFGRAGETAVSGMDNPIRTLHPVDALVHTCFHLFYKHISALRLIWLYDIHLLAEQIERMGLWREAIALSQEWQARLALKYCLEMAQDWFQTPFPERVRDLGDKPAALEEVQLFNLVMFELENGPGEVKVRKHLFQLMGLKGWDRFRYLKSRLFPTRQEIESFYPQLKGLPGPLVYLGRFALILVARN
ncbi:MAG: nucleotidyltransferase family protein [Candidatus Promineifilaceae bacterium]